MRKKPMHNSGYNNQHRKARYGQGGHSHGNNNRPRRNYGAAREKYLAQARDALASGDRVLAENYLQHADHCYRMMMEEGIRPRDNRPANTAQPGEDAVPDMDQEVEIAANNSSLPSFITDQPKPVDPATVQNWEERDA